MKTFASMKIPDVQRLMSLRVKALITEDLNICFLITFETDAATRFEGFDKTISNKTSKRY